MVPATSSFLLGLVVPIPTFPLEAIDKSSRFEPLRIANLSLAPAPVAFDCMKNLFSALLAENISKEAVAALLYISTLGDVEAPFVKSAPPLNVQLPVTVSF